VFLIKTFKINGTFRKGGRDLVFSKEITTLNKDQAVDRVYSLMGSNHKVKRSQIEITNVEELK
jgi:large subunit ribosomal protein LX